MQDEQENIASKEILSDTSLNQYQTVFGNIFKSNRQLIEEKSDLQKKLSAAEQQLIYFEEQFKLYQQKRFGRSSEKLDSPQIQLFDESGLPEVEFSDDEASDAIDIPAHQRRIKTRGRKLDTSQLTRETTTYDLSEEEKHCPCGHALHKIGEDTSEQVAHIPEKLWVKEYVRCKYACTSCKTVVMADKPMAPLPKCMAEASLLSEVVVKKYQYHLPLYRQSKILKSQGLDIPDNTLGNWVMGTASVLQPLGDALWSCIDRTHYLQADETPVTVLIPYKKAYMWCLILP